LAKCPNTDLTGGFPASPIAKTLKSYERRESLLLIVRKNMSQESQPDDLALLEEMVASHPDDVEHVCALADAYADRGSWADAIKAYEAATVLDATNADLHNSLGTIYEEVGDPEKAERAYRQAIVLRPNDSTAYYNLGLLYEEQQRIPEAIHVLEKCLQYSIDSEERSEVREKLVSMFPERKDVVQMYKRIRSWAIYLLIVGGFSIFSGSTLDPVWGVLLMVVAVLSWRIRIPAMFSLYSVTVAWAAVMNCIAVLTGADVRWLFSAIIQVSLVVLMLVSFRKYRRLPLQEMFEAGTWPAELAPPRQESSITGQFAIAGAILALIALILLPSVFMGGIVLPMMIPISQPPELVVWLLTGAVDIAVLALGLSCSAILSKNDRKGWAVGGISMSALVLIGWLVILIVPNLG